MEANRLLEDLSLRGIVVSVEGDNLIITPKASLTNTDRVALRSNKAVLLGLMREQEAKARKPLPSYLALYEQLIDTAKAGRLPPEPITLLNGIVIKQAKRYVLVTAETIERMAPTDSEFHSLQGEERKFVNDLLNDLAMVDAWLREIEKVKSGR